MEVIGADGVHVGIVERVEADRIELALLGIEEGHHRAHHHFIPGALVAAIEGDRVRLSADADVAVLDEVGADGDPLH